MRYGHVVMSLFIVWVLWQYFYENEKPLPIDAHETKAACTQQAKELSEKHAAKLLNQPYTTPEVFRCLPDTVDPRAPKAGR